MTLLSGAEGGGTSSTPTDSGNSTPTTPSPAAVESTTPTSSSWRDSLPEDIRGNNVLSSFQDVGALAKSYLHAQAAISKKGVLLPAEKATPEEWQAFYKSIGVPERDKYAVAAPKDVKLNETFHKEFQDVAHQSGLLPKQAEGLLNWYVGKEKATMQMQAQEREKLTAQGIENLKKEWSQDFDKNIALARMAVKDVGGEDLTAYLEESGLGNDPVIISFMAKVGKLLGEDKLIGEDSRKFGGQDRNEMKQEIEQTMSDYSHPYHDSNHPGHRAAVERMKTLFQKMY